MKVFGYVTLVGLAGGVLLGCKSRESARSATVETVQARVVTSQRAEIPATVKATGALHPRETVTLSAQVMGRVQYVLVREGDSVKPGQTLIIIDDATLQSASQQAESALKAAENQQIAAQTSADLATSTLARYKQLQAQKSVSLQEMDEVTRKAEAATAQVDALRSQTDMMKAQQAGARTMLAYTRVIAPFAGVITGRMADPGVLASPGVPLLQIDGAGPLQLQAAVAESTIASVHKGMKLPVLVDGAPLKDLSGIVSEIVPAADPSSHSFLVKINLPVLQALRAGMYATVAIPIGTRQAVLAPRSAIVLRGSLPCAYVLDDNNIAQLHYLTLGTTQGNSVEILSGISGNERLVNDPSDRNLSGKRIEVQP